MHESPLVGHRTVTKDAVATFGVLTGDYARLHFDHYFGAATPYADAVSMLGSTYSASYGLLWSLDPADLEGGESLARRAIELDPTLALPHLSLGAINLAKRRPEQALQQVERARSLAPSDYTAYVFEAAALTQLGRQLEALRSLQKGLRLNPRPSSVATFSSLLAGVYSNTGRMEEAVALWQQARGDNPDLIMARLDLGDHHVRTGDLTEARALVREVLPVQPALTADHVFAQGVVARSVDVEDFRDNLRSAGLS